MENKHTTIATVATGDTDQGRERDHNEDCFNIHIPEQRFIETVGALYLVADGMGGHQAGEVASDRAREVISHEYYRPSSHTGALDEGIAARLKRAVRKANQAVYDMAQSSVQRKGMGTTAVAAAVRGDEIHIANVGDSRAYLLRNGRLRQITKDHSFVQEQIDAGILTEEMARNHPQRNVITRALGHRPDVKVDTFGGPGELRPGDKVLLCSDGLTGPVSDEQIADILQRYPIDQAVTRLIDQANANGGPDNISVLLIEARPAQPGAPLAVEKPPARPEALQQSPTAPAVTAPAPMAAEAAQPAPPPPPKQGAVSRSGFPATLLALGAVALLTLIAIIAGAVLLLSRGGETSEGTPAPAIPATSTVASPGEGTVDEPTAAPEGDEDEHEIPSTSTPIPTSTAKPTGGPEATEEPAAPPPVAGEDTPTPPPPVTEVELLAPTQGEQDVRNPVVFRWRGGLAPNQRYQVTAAHADGSESKTSKLLTEATWTINLRAEKFGEWRWYVQVVEGSGDNYETRHTSDTWMFWFNPSPGGGGDPPPDEPGPQPTDPPPDGNGEKEDD